ncbi:hypothetical protein F66182_10197 [Fusarium sp. NRRL 66182]|nr:hypothetical protein F66182_10197 [Fusarium sp. NRRL 66182]
MRGQHQSLQTSLPVERPEDQPITQKKHTNNEGGAPQDSKGIHVKPELDTDDDSDEDAIQVPRNNVMVPFQASTSMIPIQTGAQLSEVLPSFGFAQTTGGDNVFISAPGARPDHELGQHHLARALQLSHDSQVEPPYSVRDLVSSRAPTVYLYSGSQSPRMKEVKEASKSNFDNPGPVQQGYESLQQSAQGVMGELAKFAELKGDEQVIDSSGRCLDFTVNLIMGDVDMLDWELETIEPAAYTVQDQLGTDQEHIRGASIINLIRDNSKRRGLKMDRMDKRGIQGLFLRARSISSHNSNNIPPLFLVLLFLQLNRDIYRDEVQDKDEENENDDDDVGSKDGTALRVARSVTATLLVIMIFFVALPIIFIHFNISVPSGLQAQRGTGQIWTPLLVPSLQPVTWFEEAMWLGVGLMSTARVTLFGEEAAERHGWRGLPGLHARDGDLHMSRPEHPHPWRCLYMPEACLLKDLYNILFTVFADLDTVANHALPQFRFTSSHSTQFRWSTSGGTFIPPHASLPTLSFDLDDMIRPNSIIRGFTSNQPTLTPTTQPSTIRYIRNLQPGLHQLPHNLNKTLFKFQLNNARQSYEVTSYWPAVTRDRVSLMLKEMDALSERQPQSRQDWGSDQDKLDEF